MTVKRDAPVLAEVRRVPHRICRVLVVDDDHDTPLVTKLVFVRIHAHHLPAQTGVGAQERVALLVRLEIGANGADAHHEPRRR